MAAAKSKRRESAVSFHPGWRPERAGGEESRGRPEFPAGALCFVLILGAAIAAYHNSFRGPLVFDDIPAIVENPSIRHLWSLQVLAAPLSAGTVGRPAVNFSLAVNYALGGVDPIGYHIANFCIHVLAALTLFGFLRRTLQLPSLRGRFAGRSRLVALSITLLWTVHPLLTQTVAYVVQRTELIASLFYLLTMYCVVRSYDAARKGGWHGWAIASCLLGMASKEMMITAPVMVWLYDRAFLSGSFKGALKQRGRLYLGLAATWLLLGALVVSHNDRNQTVGFGSAVTSWDYALTQCWAIVRYFRLALWPQGLVFDYGTQVIKNFASVWPQAGILLVLLGATVCATIRRPRLGFAGCWFFGVLAPSSSIVPLATQTVGEHRMYLPLVAIVALAGVGLFARANKNAALVVVALVGTLLGWGTAQRNEVYQSKFSLWSDTVGKRPANARAFNELGNALDSLGRSSEALAAYDQAMQLKPDYAIACYNRADLLLKMGQTDAALGLFDQALRLKPDYFKALRGKADALMRAGKGDAAIALYRQALKLQPDDADAARSLRVALVSAGQSPEAVERLEAALRVDPRDTRTHSDLGYAYSKLGRTELAMSHFAMAAQLEPDSAEAHGNYAVALQRAGRLTDAIAEYRQVIRLKPDDAVAHYTLGNVCAQTADLVQAVAIYQEALKLRPEYPEAHNNLGAVLRRLGRLDEAREHYRLALKYRPDYPQARRNLAVLAGSDVAATEN